MSWTGRGVWIFLIQFKFKTMCIEFAGIWQNPFCSLLISVLHLFQCADIWVYGHIFESVFILSCGPQVTGEKKRKVYKREVVWMNGGSSCLYAGSRSKLLFHFNFNNIYHSFCHNVINWRRLTLSHHCTCNVRDCINLLMWWKRHTQYALLPIFCSLNVVNWSGRSLIKTCFNTESTDLQSCGERLHQVKEVWMLKFKCCYFKTLMAVGIFKAQLHCYVQLCFTSCLHRYEIKW